MGPLAVTQLLALISLTVALDNGLLKTPPMGWMAWERFRCDIACKDDPKNCISEGLFRDMADRLSEDGWKELGYEYVIIDDCWMSRLRDKQGRLQPEPSRFPGGIAKLAKYIHDRGLKLGIYADMGTHTCMGYPGTTLDKIDIDAQTFASWGVDYLKFDGCSSNAVEQMLGYPLMSKALNATGRPMAYSCSWPVYVGGLPPNVNYTFLGDICHLWRNYYDIQDSWDSVLSIVEWFSNNQDDLQPAAGPGRWNDPDMEKSHVEVYWRPLSQSASALVFLSRRTDMPYLYHSSLGKLSYDAGNYEAYDVFTGATVTGLNATTEFTVSINPSGVVMWYVYPKKSIQTDEDAQENLKTHMAKTVPRHRIVL
ncbi:hypothetical protein F7725_018973 [Dissostichus mawsoni]|uniref:Alpha-galactosidase n=1 Tax=Dissostichus mawsoni TaxID=36200 RepID=A0A7J5XT17_DISMA|nr:hypothetical protein F7725_018973 [Dissostichus mawsoni]